MSPYTTPRAPSASTALPACAMTSRSGSLSASKRRFTASAASSVVGLGWRPSGRACAPPRAGPACPGARSGPWPSDPPSSIPGGRPTSLMPVPRLPASAPAESQATPARVACRWTIRAPPVRTEGSPGSVSNRHPSADAPGLDGLRRAQEENDVRQDRACDRSPPGDRPAPCCWSPGSADGAATTSSSRAASRLRWRASTSWASRSARAGSPGRRQAASDRRVEAWTAKPGAAGEGATLDGVCGRASGWRRWGAAPDGDGIGHTTILRRTALRQRGESGAVAV